LELVGVKTYIPEPRGRRRWIDKMDEAKAAVFGNRARTRRAYGKRLQRRRSELAERSFAHVCNTGGGRRTWLRGLDNIRKRLLLAAATHNLGLILRKLLGAGKPRAYDALLRVLKSLYFALGTLLKTLSNLRADELWHPRSAAAAIQYLNRPQRTSVLQRAADLETDSILGGSSISTPGGVSNHYRNQSAWPWWPSG
jgi:hypothetical protein